VGGYKFEGLAPAVYEVFATLPDGSASGLSELFLDRDSEAGNVQVTQAPTVEIEIRRGGSNAVADIPLKLTGRRQDLSETESEQEITRPRANLSPGHWQLRAHPPAGQYVESIANLRNAPRRPWKAESAPDWYEIFIEALDFEDKDYDIR
jgi:hypothetical protein